MASIFISYNRQSEDITRTLVDDIKALGSGHTVWFDQELSGGQAWWDQILEAIRKCDLFVFILNPESLNSTACKREYRYAADLSKPILPVLVADGVSTNLLPPALSKVQHIDCRKQDRDSALRLARAFNAIPPPGSLPDPLPEPPEVPISYLGSLNEQIDATPSLSYEQQSSLMIDLRRSLHNPETTDDARILLESLKKRSDCLAIIAEEIDKMLSEETPSNKEPLPSENTFTRQFKQNNGKVYALAGLGFLLFAVVAGIIYWQSFPTETAGKADTSSANENTTKPIENSPVREIPFYLNVQKMREGKPFEEPFRSVGRRIFESGYKFKMVFETVPEGFFYLFYEESKDGIGTGNFNILFPTPSKNEGLAEVKEGQKIETANNTFDDNKGTEFIWIIWTKEKQTELEDIRDFAFENEGKVSDEEKAKQLREFINKYKDPETNAENDLAKKQTIIKGKGDILVYKIELQHE